MYCVAKIKYFDDTTMSGNSLLYADLYDRFEVISQYTELAPAMEQRDFFRAHVLSTVDPTDKDISTGKSNTVVNFVVFNTEAPLYNVKAVSNLSMIDKKQDGSKTNGYYGIWANSVPFEVAKALCDFYNFRHPLFNPEDYQPEAPLKPTKLVYFKAGTSAVINLEGGINY